MKQKCIHLSEKDVRILNSIKKKYGFKLDGQTVSYLIHKHEQGYEDLAVAMRKELEDNYLPKERIRWGVQTAEQNTIMMMDVLNSLLWMLNAKNCYRVGEITHPVIKENKDELKKKIAHFKQKSDEKKVKKRRNMVRGHFCPPDEI